MTLWAWLCVVATAVQVLGEVREVPWLRYASKPVASVAFVAHGWACGAGPWILAALVLSVVGDLLLLSSDKRPFLGGLAAFLVAHVAYSVAFVALGVNPWWVLATAVPLVAIAWAVWGWLQPHVGRMARPVVAYIVVITAMVCLAAGTGHLGLLGAAVLFFASDLCVARNRFVAPDPLNRLVGLPLYYAAQLWFGSIG